MRLLHIALLGACLGVAGCLLPAAGTPVHVDMRAGSFWSGQGRLLEVDAAEHRCRVAVRHRTLFVQKEWVNCDFVHATTSRDAAGG